jgi:hypothetical protein
VAGYHWEIYRHEKDIDVSFGAQTKSVLLVGPVDQDFVTKLKHATGAHVTFWERTDATDVAWPLDRVVELVEQSNSEQLLVILETTGLKAIPVTY